MFFWLEIAYFWGIYCVSVPTLLHYMTTLSQGLACVTKNPEGSLPCYLLGPKAPSNQNTLSVLPFGDFGEMNIFIYDTLWF